MHMCAMTRLGGLFDMISWQFVTLIRMFVPYHICAMSHAYVRHDSFRWTCCYDPMVICDTDSYVFVYVLMLAYVCVCVKLCVGE